MNAVFYIEHETDEYIYIVDTGIEQISVREDAKKVVEFLKENHNLGNRRIIFRNRTWLDNEIKHQDGNYKYATFGHKGIVLPKDSDNLLRCMVELEKLRKTKI